jgi:hypothetical protein
VIGIDSVCAQTDIYRWRTYACESAAQRYAPFAKRQSEDLQAIFQNSRPNTDKRKQMLAEHNIYFEEILTKMQEQDKRVNQMLARDPSVKQSPEMTEFVDVIYGTVGYIAKKIAFTSPGLSESTYKRLLEEECKSIKVTK